MCMSYDKGSRSLTKTTLLSWVELSSSSSSVSHPRTKSVTVCGDRSTQVQLVKSDGASWEERSLLQCSHVLLPRESVDTETNAHTGQFLVSTWPRSRDVPKPRTTRSWGAWTHTPRRLRRKPTQPKLVPGGEVTLPVLDAHPGPCYGLQEADDPACLQGEASGRGRAHLHSEGRWHSRPRSHPAGCR